MQARHLSQMTTHQQESHTVFAFAAGSARRQGLEDLPWRTSSGIGPEPCRSMFARMSHGAGESSVAARDLRASAAGSAENDQAQLAELAARQ